MNCTIMTITPDMASEMLMHNKNNRKLRKYAVNTFADDMQNGRWETNAQPIVFNSNGDLLDGQHRLNAVIVANRPVDMMVVTDAPDSKLYDVGIRRTPADILFFKDTANSGFMYSTKGLAIIGYIMTGLTGNRHGLTPNALLQYIEGDKERLSNFFDYCVFETGSSTQAALRRAVFPAALYYAFVKDIDANMIHRFYEVFTTGHTSDDNESVIIACREKILKDNKHMTDIERAKRIQWALDKYLQGIIDYDNKCPKNLIYNI